MPTNDIIFLSPLGGFLGKFANIPKQALEIAEALVRSGAVDIIVVDSVAALVTRAEIDGEMGDSHVGQLARLMSQALRKLAGALSKSNCAAIFINQLREKIGVMYGNPETTPGGRALKFYSSVRIDVRKGEAIKEGNEIIGNNTRIKIVKNKVAPPFKTAEFDIMYGSGICHTGEIIDAGVELSILKKSGAWFYYGETRLGQGRDNVKKLFEDNTELANEIEEKIMQAVSSGQEASATEFENDEEAIMPEEPTARPRKTVDIDIAVDE